MYTARQIADLANYGSQAVQEEDGILTTAVKFTTAATVDLAAVTVDSLLPDFIFGDTGGGQEWLDNIDDAIGSELGRFYQDHEDGVQLASFVGGIFLPGMAASKLVKYASSGAKPFSSGGMFALEQGIQTGQREALAAFTKLGRTAPVFREAMNKSRLNTLGKGVAEGLVYEAAFYQFMNGHAYLDEDYGAADFALGVGLGSLVGPLRWWAKNNEIKTQLLEIEKTQKAISSEAYPVRLIGETNGHTATNISMMLTEARRLSREPPPSLSVDEIANVNAAAVEGTLNLTKQIEKMSSGQMVDFIATRKKEGPINLEKRLSADLFDENPTDVLAHMGVNQPGVFTGVDKFDIWHTVDYEADVIESALRRDPFSLEAINSEVARVAVSGQKNKWKNSAKAREFAEENIPEGVDIRQGMDTGITEVSIPDTKTLKNKDFRKWFNAFASQEEMQARQLIVRSQEGGLDKLKLKDAELLEAASKTRQKDITEVFHTRFVTPDEADELIDLERSTAVIDPYFGPTMIPSGRARLACGATSCGVDVDKTITAGKVMKYSQDDAVGVTDGQFIESLYLVKNDPKRALADTPIEIDNLPLLQAAFLQKVQRFPGTQYTIKVKGADGVIQEIANPAELNKLLVQAKMDEAKSIIARGGSLEQAARKTNSSLQDMEVGMAAKWSTEYLPEGNHFVPKYSDIKNPEKYVQNRTIKIVGKDASWGKLEEARGKALLDNEHVRSMHDGLVRDYTNTAQVEGISKLHAEVVDNDLIKTLRDNLPTALTNTGADIRVIGSRDFQLRRLGSVGEAITTLGQRFKQQTNDMWVVYAEALDSPARAVAADQASTVQFEQLKRAIHSLGEGRKAHYVADEGKFALRTDRQGKAIEYLTYLDDSQEIVLTPTMRAFMEAYEPVMREQLSMRNLNRTIYGQKELNDKGVWFPYEAVDNEFVAYMVKNGDARDTRIITARDSKALAEQINLFRRDTSYSGYSFVTREDLGQWNQLQHFSQLNELRRADASQLKTGIAPQVARTDTSGIDQFLGQLQSGLWNNNRTYLRSALSDVFDALDFAARREEAVFRSSKGTLAQKLQQGPSVPEAISKTMTNESLVNRFPVIQLANDVTSANLNIALNSVHKFFQNRRDGDIFKRYEDLNQVLIAENIPNPWKSLEEFAMARNLGTGAQLAEHRIAQTQGILATLNLRLMDASHAAVTLMSLPVILSGELTSLKYPMKTMVQAAKWMHTPEGETILRAARDRGHVSDVVHETSELMATLYTKEGPGKFKRTVDLLSKPADWSERYTRSFAYAVGWNAAKQKAFANGVIASDEMLEASAAQFTLRTMGNYISRQRPTMFQGSFGSMIGLYQTFMMTMGQNLFKYLERGDKKAIATLLGSQAGMFGIESLPFYEPVNKFIGEYVSNGDHEDLTATTYNIFGNADDQSRSLAEFMLFGAPSTLLQTGVYTRGQLAPRSAFRLGSEGLGLDPAILNNARQAYDFLWNTSDALGKSATHSGLSGDLVHSALQGFAAQSVWRPGARLAELAMGQSYDRKGELLAAEEEVYQPFAMFARGMGSRPLKEQALRALKYDASYYSQVDSARRKKLSKAARRIVATDANPYALGSLQLEYMNNGGSNAGWKTIIKNANTAVDEPLAARLSDFAKKQAAIQPIMDSYIN